MPVADEAQKWWYKVSGSGWLPQSDVEEVSQYDLLKLGFQALEEDGNSDVMQSRRSPGSTDRCHNFIVI